MIDVFVAGAALNRTQMKFSYRTAPARVLEFSARQGFGPVELLDGQRLVFGATVCGGRIPAFGLRWRWWSRIDYTMSET
jgi:hypothetical protein